MSSRDQAEKRVEEIVSWYREYIGWCDSYLDMLRREVEHAKTRVRPHHKIVILSMLFKLLSTYCEHWVRWLTNSEETYRTLLAYADELNSALDVVFDHVVEAFRQLYEADKALVKAVVDLIERRRDEIVNFELGKARLYLTDSEQGQRGQAQQHGRMPHII